MWKKGDMPEIGLNIWPFITKIFIVEYFPWHYMIPNTPYVIFFHIVGVPKIKKKLWYPKIISTRDIKDFWLKQKNLKMFVPGVPNVLWEGVKLDFWIFFFIGVSATRNLGKYMNFLGIGCLKILWVKGIFFNLKK